MHSLSELLDLSEGEKERLGVVFTPAEIVQQPDIWEKTGALLQSKNTEIREFFRMAKLLSKPESSIVISGAGTSEYVGNSAASMLQWKLGIPVRSVGTTEFILEPEHYLLRNRNNLVISIARSGDSPESVTTYLRARIVDPDVWQLVITCNRDGALANETREDGRSLLLVLPEESNDRGLAMTSSFSSMLLSLISLGYLDDVDTLLKLTASASLGARRILDSEADNIQDFFTVVLQP